MARFDEAAPKVIIIGAGVAGLACFGVGLKKAQYRDSRKRTQCTAEPGSTGRRQREKALQNRYSGAPFFRAGPRP